MPDGIRWVGLDVHAHESTIAILDQATGEVTTRRVVGRPHELLPSRSFGTQYCPIATAMPMIHSAVPRSIPGL
jgi:hypothetical protein